MNMLEKKCGKTKNNAKKEPKLSENTGNKKTIMNRKKNLMSRKRNYVVIFNNCSSSSNISLIKHNVQILSAYLRVCERIEDC